MPKKKKLTGQQEFEIMKLVLDKFLWVGFVVMGYGMFLMFDAKVPLGLMWMLGGAVLLVLFVVLIVKEYEMIK